MRIGEWSACCLVVLSVGVPVDMFACGDKFLIAGRYTRYQRPKNCARRFRPHLCRPRRRLWRPQ